MKKIKIKKPNVITRHLELDARWKVKAMVDTGRFSDGRLSAPWFNGKEVEATNGHVLAVFPHEAKGVKPGFICKPPRKAEWDFPDTKAIKGVKRDFAITFDVDYLNRLLDSIGYDKTADHQKVVFEFCTKKKKNGEYEGIKVRFNRHHDNKAWGIIMPIRADNI